MSESKLTNNQILALSTKEEKKIAVDKKFPGAVEHVKALLEAIGEDPNREGLKDTPYRVVKSFIELYKGYDESPEDVLSTFFSEESEKLTDGMVLCDHITFYSTCEHHMIPFSGVCHIGYLPNDKVVGLSKFIRLVEAFGRRLQIQERLGCNIADAIMNILKPRGVGVVIIAKHLCTSSRGAANHTNHMTTSNMRGEFRTEPETRAEFLKLIELSGTVNLSV